MTEIVLPDSLKYLGSFVFNGCSGLSKVSFNGTLEEAGYGAFNTTPFFDQSKQDMVILQNVLLKYQGTQKELTIPSEYNIIAPSAFEANTTLTEVTIPEGIKNIGSSAFEGCTKLAVINMPSTSFAVGENAFANTAWIKNQKEDFVILSNGTLIKYQAGDKTVIVPDAVTVIARGAFVDVILDKVTIPGTVKSISAGTFQYSLVSEIILEDGVEQIAFAAFDETRISLIDIPDSVTSIGRSIAIKEEGILNYVVVCSKGSAAYQYGMTAGIGDVSIIRVKIR